MEQSHIREIAREVAREENVAVIATLNEIKTMFKEFLKSENERNEKLVGEVVIKLKHVAGDFKDKAVEESIKNNHAIVSRLFNINMNGHNADIHIEELQGMLRLLKYFFCIKTKIIIYAIMLFTLILALIIGSGGNIMKIFLKWFS